MKGGQSHQRVVVIWILMISSIIAAFASSAYLLIPSSRAGKCWDQFTDAEAWFVTSVALCVFAVACWFTVTRISSDMVLLKAIENLTVFFNVLSIIVIALLILSLVAARLPELASRCATEYPTRWLAFIPEIPIISIVTLVLGLRWNRLARRAVKEKDSESL